MTGLLKTLSLLSSMLLTVSVSAQFRDDSSYADLYDGETVASLKGHVRELSSAMMEGSFMINV